MALTNATRICSLSVLLLVALIGGCHAALIRNGVFNNRTELASALHEHEVEWDQRGLGKVLDRRQVHSLLQEFEGTCITEEADWVRVDFNVSIDHYGEDAGLIACHFPVKARWPREFLRTFTWTLVFRPLGNDKVTVAEVRRVSTMF